MSQFVYGRQAVRVLLASGRTFARLFVTDKDDPLLGAFEIDAKKVEVLSPAQMDERFRQANHQRIVAEVTPFAYKDEGWLKKNAAREGGLVVLLDGIEDPQNLGAIARTAWAAGALALLVKADRQAGVSPHAIRASAGYLLSIPVVKVSNLTNAIKTLRDLGYWMVGATDQSSGSYRGTDVARRLAVVIGNEHKGISRLVKQQLDYEVGIAMANKVQSLNASAAAAVVLMDIHDRRQTSKTKAE